MRADARWARIDEIYHSALERPADERASFVRRSCAGDEELRREIESLLGYEQKKETFLEPVTRPVLTAGQSLGSYRVLSQLGRGGMGEVYLAEDTRLGRRVALKVLPSEVASDSGRKARLIREARAASALNHPNIVTVHDIGSEGGLDFVVMEYVEGQTLDQLLAHSSLKLKDALASAVQVADALAKAHAAGIVHRDLKPSNVMVTEDGLVKVLDFGLAKLAADDKSSATATCTEDGMMLGTVGYMSPEQAEGRTLDARSDIFSFGAVLYEMVTGRRAFLRDTAISTIFAILRDEPKRPAELAPGIPPELERIIVRCLRKDRERRFQHMDDVRVALLETKEESELKEPAVAPARTRWWWTVSIGAAVLLVAGLWLIRRHFASAPEARLVQITAYAGSELYPSFSPDGKQVAFSWDGESGTNPGVYVKLLGETTALRLTTGPDTFPAWAPDGKRVAFARGHPNGGVYTVSALGGAERKLSDLVPNSPMSWSPDGKWLAVTMLNDHDRGILFVPADGGTPRRISSPTAPASDRSPGFSPDGKRLAYAGCAGEFPCDVYIQEIDSNYSPRGVPRKITDQRISIWTGLTWTRDGRAIIYAGSKAPGYVSYLWRVGLDGRQAPKRLEVAGPAAFSASASPTDDRVVFHTPRWDYDIWRYRVGSGFEPLITSSLTDDNPQFSPDGTRIAFESSRSGEGGEIWVAQADGSKPVQITNRLGCCPGTPRWSPDGRWIAFDSLGERGDWDVWLMEGSGASPHRITSDPSDENMPSWSRDGTWIYFESDRTGRPEIWRVPSAGGQAQQITTRRGYAAFESVDGNTLYYTKADSGPLFAIPLSGGEERQVLPYVSQRAFVPVADGIYYIGQPRDRPTLDLVNIINPAIQYPLQFFQFSNGTSTLLAKTEGILDYGLSVSPDRKTIVFSKSVAAGADVMMIENFQ